jgi:hypothetical protein
MGVVVLLGTASRMGTAVGTTIPEKDQADGPAIIVHLAPEASRKAQDGSPLPLERRPGRDDDRDDASVRLSRSRTRNRPPIRERELAAARAVFVSALCVPTASSYVTIHFR